jgi:endonuclease-3
VNAERRRRAAEILDRLAAEHPDASIALHWSTPLELLVATILSAQSTDVGVNNVTETLFRRFRTPEDYLAAPVGDLEMLIKPTGFFRQKSAAIRGCCAAILERHGGEVPRTTAELVKLPGVGRKTAAVVRTCGGCRSGSG